MVNSSIGLGGVPRVMSIWAELFTKKGYEVEVVANIKSKIFYDFNIKVKKTFLNIDQFGVNGKLKILYSLIKFFRYRENEIIIFNKAHYINYVFILKIFGIISNSNKLIYFVHGGSSDFKIFYSNFKKYLIYKIFNHAIALHDDYDSFKYEKKKSLKRIFIDYCLPDYWLKIKNKILYIPNPISFKSKRKAELESYNFIAAGRLDHIKGFDLLIQSWVYVEMVNPNYNLKIFGDGVEKERLEFLIKKNNLKNVFLLPATKQIKNKLLDSCGYIMSSREEGMPMILLEAMECGLPIITFNNSGASYLVEDKLNGLICKVGDIKSLARNVLYLAENRNKIKEYGKVSADKAKSFYKENLFHKWDQILNN